MITHFPSFQVCVISAVSLLFVAASSGVSFADEPLQYNRDIRPILAENCLACHGLDNICRQADLRLDVRDAAVDAGAIVPGDADASEMIARILSEDPDTVMPPPSTKKTITAAQRDLLRRWISEGAHYEKHWALIAPTSPPVPSADNSSTDHSKWAKNEIDAFVLDRLQRE